jgi:hypothetical protein
MLVVLVALVGIGATGLAFAYWGATGSGTGSAMTGTLNAPTAVQAQGSAGTGDVSVSWTASATSASAPAPTGYYVIRTDSTSQSAPACGSSATNLIATTGCTDPSVGLGTFTYTVVAVFHSWTATSQPSAAATVSPAAQQITFTSTPVSPAFDGSYQVSADGGGSGNPVTFTATTQSVCTSSGTAGATISFVGVGTCTISADQAGSSYYSPAPTAVQSFTVAKAAQSIDSFTAPSSGVYGQAGALAGHATSGLPVSFGTSTPGTCTVSGSTVTYAAAGLCTVVANQAGNANYGPATQVSQTFSIGKADQSITSFTAPSSGTYNGSGSVSAGATSGLTVTFGSTTTAVCTVSGSTVTYVGAGNCTLTADQGGDSNWNAASQVTRTFTVAKADQTVTFTSTAPTGATAGGATYTVSATASSGLTAITFASTTTSVCTVSGSTVSFVGAGTCTVQATQAGNANYNPASKTQTFAVGSGTAVTGIVWTNASIAGGNGQGSGGFSCTAVGTSSSSCAIGASNNGSFKAQLAFVNAQGALTVYSVSNDSTIPITESGQGGTASGSLTIKAGNTTSSSFYGSRPKNGSNLQTMTATFIVGNLTYTATLSG